MTDEAVGAYIDGLPDDRKEAIRAVRGVVASNLDLAGGFEEGVQSGMISWHVPLSRYPGTYNRQPLGVVALASQKNHMALYLSALYYDSAETAWFRDRWAATGKRLDMGKSCLRFKRLDDLALDVIGESMRRLSVDGVIAAYERARSTSSR